MYDFDKYKKRDFTQDCDGLVFQDEKIEFNKIKQEFYPGLCSVDILEKKENKIIFIEIKRLEKKIKDLKKKYKNEEAAKRIFLKDLKECFTDSLLILKLGFPDYLPENTDYIFLICACETNQRDIQAFDYIRQSISVMLKNIGKVQLITKSYLASS
jgi:hypothetical protein